MTEEETLHPDQGEHALEPPRGVPLLQVQALVAEDPLDHAAPAMEVKVGKAGLLAGEAVPFRFQVTHAVGQILIGLALQHLVAEAAENPRNAPSAILVL